ncbi:MAG: hypothetical protein M3019_03385 [Candidatus Dormibacteraeota bacterium]|nr:hypothetical protein [Candidatus Dormibacteraeota bacterium]
MPGAAALALSASVIGVLVGGHPAPVGPVRAAAAGTAPHVMVIVEENKAYSASDGSPFIIGNSNAPYINSLASQYSSATRWYAQAHGSVSDYYDLIAGSPETGNAVPYADTTVVDELAAKGVSWKAYMEDMPSPCYTGADTGNYLASHNPFVDFNSIRNNPSQCANVVPYSQASADLNGSSPPSFVWITPNQCNDMHTSTTPCPTNAVSTGDLWLKNNLQSIMSSAWYQQNGTIIVTWDESVGTDTSGWNGGVGGHVATLVISKNNSAPYTGGGNLLGILRGIEETYGVGLLGASSDPGNGDISAAFGISSGPPPPPPFSPQHVGAPQVAVTPDGSTQLVFWKDTGSSQLTEAWYAGGSWHGPISFPQLGTLTSTPAVGVSKDGRTQLVFWQGPGGHLLEAWYTGSWHGPLDISATQLNGQGILASSPSIVTTTDGSQLIFWRGTDGHLAEAWYSNGWHGPVDFTGLGSLASAPSATVTADGSTQLVFFQGTNNQLTEDWYAGGAWHGPLTLGSLTSPPSVAVTPDGSTQLVFYRSSTGHLLESWYAGGSWHGPADFTATSFGGQGLLTSSPSAAVTPDGSTQLVFWQGSGNTLWEGWYAGGAWHGPVDFSA